MTNVSGINSQILADIVRPFTGELHARTRNPQNRYPG
jgi:hypothetical protein